MQANNYNLQNYAWYLEACPALDEAVEGKNLIIPAKISRFGRALKKVW